MVTGHPATGKSTLAEALAAELRLPSFHKDVVKEQLADVLGSGDRAWSQRLGHASTVVLYDLADRVLAAGRSCIVESYFPAEFASAPLRSSAERRGARVVQVVLTCPHEVMARRFAARRRHPVHVLPELSPLPPYVPLDLPGVRLEIDTTDLPVDTTAIVAAVNGG